MKKWKYKKGEVMPIDKSASHEEIVQELMHAYEKNGKIGNHSPKDKEEAQRIANAIAYKGKGEN